ncbi:MAG TPA: Uma2 family endonuclease [Gemmataceae bacterium]|jgi:Uma2 family endonuclease|nr:Uma2 family endonuclease [Gemmataceae bacterium]
MNHGNRADQLTAPEGQAVEVAETSQPADPEPRRWTKTEFYEMAELGWFRGQRVELIEGQVMVLSPQKFAHYATVDKGGEVLRATFASGFWVRTQAPINLGTHSEPEPDVSVVQGSRGDYTAHPTTAVLLVEVSETTLANDRGPKASLYARAGIADYWIVNLVRTQLEVYRDPGPDPAQPFGFGYATRIVLSAQDVVSPLAAPQQPIAVADLFA